MSEFQYVNGELHAEQVSLGDIAKTHGTPCFVYSKASLVNAYREFSDTPTAGQMLICYAVKANANLAVLNCLAREGAGFDIVSGGELQRVLAAGASADKIVFSGVGKTADEINRALDAGVRCFNVESESELHHLDQLARAAGKVAPISLRINPDVDAGTHPYISTGLRENKFGIAHDRALRIYQLATSLPGLKVVGIDCHIGSQITDLAPFLAALDKLLELIEHIEAAGIPLEHIDLGGGLGIDYEGEDVPTRRSLISAVNERLLERLGERAKSLELVFEFGRSIAAPAGVLITQVTYLKPTEAKNFAIIDAAMNDLLRPTLYGAWHRLEPLIEGDGAAGTQWDVVGPICESGDWLAKDRTLALAEGDLLVFGQAGAYAMAMSSNYNSRGKAAEVMVDGNEFHLVRERETFAQLIAGEHMLPK